VKKKEEKKEPVLVYELKENVYSELYSVRTDSIKIKYLEQYKQNNKEFNFKLIDESNKLISQFNFNDKTIIKEGLIAYTILLRFPGLNLKNGIYILVVENAKKEKWYLKFNLL